MTISSKFFMLYFFNCSIIAAISGAIGDLNLNGNEGNFSSAIHAKCLLCDKPVNGLLNNLQRPKLALGMGGAAGAGVGSAQGNKRGILQSQSVNSLRDKMQIQGGFPQV